VPSVAPPLPVGTAWTPGLLAAGGGFVAIGAGVLIAWVTAAGIGLAPFAAGARFRFDDLMGTGLRLDGIIVSACAFIGLTIAVAFRRIAPTRFAALTGGLAGIALAIGLLQWEMIAAADQTLPDLVNPGIGLWFVTAGSVVALAGAGLVWKRGPR
jgi:hypothetical protein